MHIIPPGSLIGYMSNLVKTHGGINLAQGIPGFAPPEELTTLLQQLSKSEYHQYAPGNGDLLLREMLLLHPHYHKVYHPDNLLLTLGATEAITLVFMHLKNKIAEQFGVLAFDPVYESYKNLPGFFGLQFYSFCQNENGATDFEKLEQCIVNQNIKLILICSPGNPLGKTWSKSELAILLALCSKYAVNLIIDAVYSDLYFNNPPQYPLEPQLENLFYVNSFSKKLSITGWRIGYLLCSKSNMASIRHIHDYTGLSCPNLLQHAIGLYLQHHNFGSSYCALLREDIKTAFLYLHQKLTSLGFKIPPIDGGYFIWAQLPEKFTDGYKFALDLYESKKVAVVPGIHFSENGNAYIRLNIARPMHEIEKACRAMESFCGDYLDSSSV